MNVVLFPNQTIRLTKKENERFIWLKEKLRQSIAPSEALYYKNELDSMVSKGRTQKKSLI